MKKEEAMELLRGLGAKAKGIISLRKDGKKASAKNYFGHRSNRMDICIENMVKRGLS